MPTRRQGIQLAYPFEEKRLAKWNPPYIVQPKLDGDRCWNQIDAINQAKPICDLITSEGNIFQSVPHIVSELESSKLAAIPLDGELYSHELYIEGGHELIFSIVSRTVNLHPRHHEMEFHVFDYKNANQDQATRLNFLHSIESDFPLHVKLVPIRIAYTLDDVKHVYDEFVKMKYEGIIVRNIEAFYVERRSTFMMKFKPKRSDTYKIIGWNEEIAIDGEPKGRIGSLILTSGFGDVFNVGAGLDADQKAFLWDMRDALAGKNATVFYQHLTNRQIPKGSFDIIIPELGLT
ncbi:MAG: hypothetical protein KKD44_26005 [Proteobacteria bacterium]|nr:hypothetical protein [Pseudomonadota bacterium]